MWLLTDMRKTLKYALAAIKVPVNAVASLLLPLADKGDWDGHVHGGLSIYYNVVPRPILLL